MLDKNGRNLSKMDRKQWEKQKLLVTSNFSFSHSIFRRLILQTPNNQGLFGKGLIRKVLKTYLENGENSSNQHFLIMLFILLEAIKPNSNRIFTIFVICKCFHIVRLALDIDVASCDFLVASKFYIAQ